GCACDFSPASGAGGSRRCTRTARCSTRPPWPCPRSCRRPCSRTGSSGSRSPGGPWPCAGPPPTRPGCCCPWPTSAPTAPRSCSRTEARSCCAWPRHRPRPAGPGTRSAWPWRSRAGGPAPWTGVLRTDLRLRVMTAIVLVLAVTGIAIFWLFSEQHLDLIDAVYFTVTIMTTTGFGDIHLRNAPPPLQLYGVALMLSGTAALAILFALITDALISARLARMIGAAIPRGLHDHV